MSIRIIVLRLLVASWCIPLSWVVFFPLFLLLSGDLKGEITNIKEFNRYLWDGLE